MGFAIIAECPGRDVPQVIDYANTVDSAGVKVCLYREQYGPYWHIWYEGTGPDRKFGRFRNRRLRRIRARVIDLFKRDAVPELMLKERRLLRYRELAKYYQEQ